MSQGLTAGGCVLVPALRQVQAVAAVRVGRAVHGDGRRAEIACRSQGKLSKTGGK